jgi:hypothetical protein
MDLTAKRPSMLDFRRIRIRSVCGVTKVLGAAEAAIMSFWQDLSSLSSEPDSCLDRYSKLATIALSILLVLLVCDPSSSDLVDLPKLPQVL